MPQLSELENERNVVLLTGIGHFSTHFAELMYPTLAVALARETGFPLGQVLSWSFFGYLLFGLGALPAGLLADRIGVRVLLIGSLAGMGVCALAAAESTSGTALIICLAGIGGFASVYHPAGMSLISRTVTARGRALGVNGIFGSVAIASTPVIVAALCEARGWQGAFYATGLSLCILAAACAFLPIDERPRAAERRPHLPVTATRHGDKLLFGLLCVSAMLAGISYRGNTLLQPAYFAERVSLLGFGATTSLVYLFGIGGQYVGGILADRYDLRWLYLLFHAFSLPALLAMTALGGVPLIASAAVFVFFSIGMQPIENSLFARLTPPRWRATGYGVKFILTFGVGSSAVWLVEWAQNAGDLRYALLCLGVVIAALLAVMALFIGLSAGVAVRNDAGGELLGTAPPLRGGESPAS